MQIQNKDTNIINRCKQGFCCRRSSLQAMFPVHQKQSLQAGVVYTHKLVASNVSAAAKHSLQAMILYTHNPACGLLGVSPKTPEE